MWHALAWPGLASLTPHGSGQAAGANPAPPCLPAPARRSARLAFVSLANNHSLDFTESGLAETLEVLEGEGIACAGGWLRAWQLGGYYLVINVGGAASPAQMGGAAGRAFP